MSATTSAATGRCFGIQRVWQVWERSRSALYARRARAHHRLGAGPARRGPPPRQSDAQLLAAIRTDLARSPFHGEGHRKVHARLRILDGIRVARTRVLRVMRAHGLLSPHRGRQGAAKTHDGRVITQAPNVMWGTDGVRVFTLDDGWGWIFAAVEHWNAECVGWHVCKVGSRFAALDPIAQGLERLYGSLDADVARGLALRMDETRRALDAEERHLLLKVVSQIVRPVVVPKTQPAGDALANRAEAGADALADRLQGLKSGPALGRMQADALGRAVIDGHEDEGRALAHGHCGRHVRAPHHIGGRGGDRAVVRLRAVRVAHAVRGLEVVLPTAVSIPATRSCQTTSSSRRPGRPVLGDPPQIEFGFVEEPETNGVAERWNRTLNPLRSKRSTAESFRTSRPSASPWPTSWSGTTRPGVSRSLGITRLEAVDFVRARSMCYARRHSTNVCPGNRVRYTLGYRRSRGPAGPATQRSQQDASSSRRWAKRRSKPSKLLLIRLTVLAENVCPHNSSVIALTLRVDTPCTYISARALTRAFSER